MDTTEPNRVDRVSNDSHVESEKLRRQAETRLRAAAAGEREARENLSSAEELMLVEIDGARDLGLPWARIAELTGLTETQAQWRIHKGDPSATDQRERRRVPADKRRSRLGTTRPGRGPGLSVTEYAQRVGKTRRTVYSWIEAGRIDATKNELGQVRVTSDPAEAPAQPE